MPQFEVKIFQQARINTETFTVEAESPEQAQAIVRDEHLAGKDLVTQQQPFEIEISELQQMEPIIGQQPAQPEPISAELPDAVQ